MNNILNEVCGVNWNSNCCLARSEAAMFSNIEENLIKVAHWCKQIESIYQDNLALPFIREAQISAHDYCCMISLGLYKASASSLRTILESFLYFSYFKDHPVELRTLSSIDSYYMSKKEIIEYHNVHTSRYKEKASDANLTKGFDEIYSDISKIIHGQMPGVWHSSTTLKEKKFNKDIAKDTADKFVKLVNMINLFMLIVISDEDWLNVDKNSKTIFLRNLSGDMKNKLNRR